MIMEEFKFKNAVKDGVDLKVNRLTAKQIDDVLNGIKQYAGIDLKKTALMLLRGETPTFWKECEFSAYEISSTSDSILRSGTEYIIWSESDIDLVNRDLLVRFFDYFWYESSDDIFIVSIHLDELFFIRHDGAIFRYQNQ